MIYTHEDFATACSLRGYCRKKEALRWLKQNNITTPTEDDFQRCYHDVQAEPIHRHEHGRENEEMHLADDAFERALRGLEE